MPITDSPLRYPGGKTQLAPLVIDILKANKLLCAAYSEPFAGGCGLALKLLLNSYVNHIYINDADRSIYAFWHSVINSTDELCSRIQTTRISIAEWRKQREIQDRRYSSLIDLGFSTLFMNRTNRSGIIRGGVIGGVKQDGSYKMGCRFNKADLIRKIERIADHKSQITLSRLDARKFLSDVVPTIKGEALINLDPPYIQKGPDLYRNYYQFADHALLAKAVRRIKHFWMVTYDDTDHARALYHGLPIFTHELNYTAQIKRTGVELLVLDPKLSLPSSTTEELMAA